MAHLMGYLRIGRARGDDQGGAHALYQLTETRALTRRRWPPFYTEFLDLEKVFDLGWIASFRPPANQAAQVSLVSGDATAHEDSVLSVDVDDVDVAYVLAQATGLLPDYDKCQRLHR